MKNLAIVIALVGLAFVGCKRHEVVSSADPPATSRRALDPTRMYWAVPSEMGSLCDDLLIDVESGEQWTMPCELHKEQLPYLLVAKFEAGRLVDNPRASGELQDEIAACASKSHMIFAPARPGAEWVLQCGSFQQARMIDESGRQLCDGCPFGARPIGGGRVEVNSPPDISFPRTGDNRHTKLPWSAFDGSGRWEVAEAVFDDHVRLALVSVSKGAKIAGVRVTLDGELAPVSYPTPAAFEKLSMRASYSFAMGRDGRVWFSVLEGKDAVVYLLTPDAATAERMLSRPAKSAGRLLQPYGQSSGTIGSLSRAR